MSNRKNGAAAIAASAVALAAPSLALAEENSDLGIGILIPNLSEFIPALIAFLVIWVVLAKFAWPMIVGMLDKRQETIKNNLDEAEAAKIEAQRSLEEYKKQLAELLPTCSLLSRISLLPLPVVSLVRVCLTPISAS